MNCKKTLLMACCALFAAAVHAQVTIDIDTQQRGPKVSPMLYGIFYETSTTLPTAASMQS